LVLLPGVEGGPRPERLAQTSADVAVAYGLPDGVPSLAAVRRRRLPLVVIDSPLVRGSSRVEVDDVGGATSAAEHLLDLGHREIGVLMFQLSPDGTEGEITEDRRAAARYRTTRNRLDGYLAALAAAGLDPARGPLWECPGSRQELGRTGAARLLSLRPRPTALLCASDELALGALQAARDQGLRVPADVSVVGFDDTPSAQSADPPLTTVQQPLEAKGHAAGEFALALLAGRTPRRVKTLATTLVVRGSTARL
jgi:DNA-binding LacI/PurR family transcriptional regulator